MKSSAIISRIISSVPSLSAPPLKDNDAQVSPTPV